MTSMGALLDANSLPVDRARMGGKGASLHALHGLGLAPVPAFAIVPTDAFDKVMARHLAELQQRLQPIDHDDVVALGLVIDDVHAAMLGATLPFHLAQEVVRFAHSLGTRIAVRSSANQEDGVWHAFAGQLSTEMGVAADDAAHAVGRCWASMCSLSCIVYLRRCGIAINSMSVAVVLQAIVEPDAAGVCFSANPNGARDKLVVVSAHGFGETVVAGDGGVDDHQVDSAGGLVCRLGRKTFARRMTDRGVMIKTPIAEAAQQLPSLSDDQVHRIATLTRTIAQHQGRDVDVEWAIDKQNQLWLLQSRPITTLPHGAPSVFDRANVIESFPGISSPLTFSHARESYEHVFRNTLAVLGVPRDQLWSEDAAFRSLLGYIHGRIAYNTISWIRVLRLLPGIEPYLRSWEDMLGVSEQGRHTTQAAPTRPIAQWWRTGWRVLWLLVRLGARHRRFFARFDAAAGDLANQDVQAMDGHQVVESYRAQNARLLDGWEITFLNDGYAFAFTSLAKWLLKRAGVNHAVLPMLLTTQRLSLESRQPLDALQALGKQLKALGADARARYQQGAEMHCIPTPVGEDDRRLQQQLEMWLANYGDRRAEELKLESPTHREDIGGVLRLLGDVADQDIPVRTAHDGYSTARRQVRHALRWQPIARLALWLSLSLAHRSIALREASRLRRTRAFGQIRRLFLRAGEVLHHDGLLAHRDDVFKLSTDEVFSLVKGTSLPNDTQQLVAERKRQLAMWENARPLNQFRTQGVVAAHPIPTMTANTVSSGDLVGLACAAGVARGRALVVRDPRQARAVAGTVLVAESTDPGWVFLMATAAALVVERGSLLSHTAIIGRELGIPTVVNVEAATERIADGMWLEVNGHTGVVRILNSKDEP